MDNIPSFREAQVYFLGTWAPERLSIITELSSIKDELQRQAKIHSIGSITYSSVGLIGGGLAIAGIITAPFTLGASLGLTVAGIATGVTSGAAGLTHGVVKIGIVKKKCNEAKASLENHEDTSKIMKRLVKALEDEIRRIETIIKERNELEISHTCDGVKQAGGALMLAKDIANLVVNSRAVDVYRIAGNADEVARILSIGTALDDLVPSALKDVSKGAAKLSTEALSTLAAIGILIDLGSLIWNAVDLSKMEKGKLCSEAEKLNTVIETLQKEYDVLRQCFE